ncbi:MAG: ADP-ribosylation factor-directed GTPase activating protein isoform b [Lacipirellulaceae bacterium]
MTTRCVFFCLLCLLTGCQQGEPAASGGAKRAPQAKLPSEEELRELVDRTLEFTEHGRVLDLDTQAAWQILHGVLAFGRDFTMRTSDGPENVLDWVFSGKPMKGWTLEPGQVGLRATIEPGKFGQGHEDQWLAVISQCGVPIKQPLEISGQEEKYTLYDLLKQAMFDCYEGKESSWTLIALSQYLDPIDQTWTGRDGEQWSLERLAGMEAGPTLDETAGQAKVNEGACGGTHRVIGLAMALNRYRAKYPDRKLSGGWLAAQKRIAWAIAQSKKHQLPSGAFSIQYFMRPANSGNLAEHLASTGHTLEFLSVALPTAELKEPWVQRSVVYLCNLLERSKELDLECGALYHAAHGLVLYRQRVFDSQESSVAISSQ